MIYPKGIVEFINNNISLKEKFGHNLFGDKLHISDNHFSEFACYEFDVWMREEGFKESVEIRKYLFFLSAMFEAFETIRSSWPEINSDSKTVKDKSQIATSVKEMLDMASYIYYLDSYGIKGDILECGCYKGFSSCCLSLVCDSLGKKLLVADSFEGLPEVEHPFYLKGDFKGGLSEVKNNILAFGKMNCVEFIEGWYNKSLVGFDRPICLLWMDVDLYGSVLDVLNNVFHKLDKDGVIFSHEMSPFCLDGDQILRKPESEVANAINVFFENEGVSYKAKYLTGNSGLIVPNAKTGKILFSPQNIDVLVMKNLIIPSIISDFDSLPKISSETVFWIDSVNGMPIKPEFSVQNNIELIIKGWAVDTNSKNVAGAVDIMIDDKVCATIYGYEREDVGRKLGIKSYRYSGFEARIPPEKIKPGDHMLSLRILSNEKNAYYAPDQKTAFKVRT